MGPATVTHSNPSPQTAIANISQAPPVASRRPALAECNLCSRSIPLAQWNEHLHDPVHVRKARLTAYHQIVEDGSRNKFGVSITQPELDFGIIDISTLTEWPTRENVFYVRLEEGAVILKNIGLTSQLGSQTQFRDSKYALFSPKIYMLSVPDAPYQSFSVRFSAALTLSPGVTYAVKVTFDPKGMYVLYIFLMTLAKVQP